MESYEQFAPFYDAAMGDRKKSSNRLIEFISKYNPNAKKVLELACGTGRVLKNLPRKYEIYGLDLSRRMLAVAKINIPRARLSRQNMVHFRLSEKFDVILCVFDSINHVLKFDDWEKLFVNTSKHLASGGIFIFDINTEKKLNRHISEPAWIHQLGNDFLSMKVSDGGNGVSVWNIKVFERVKGNKYLLHEEDIKEVSFPAPKIITALKRYFRKVDMIDTDESHPTRKGERLYFICAK
jgi:predicted TPR repeat methyltransferase